MENKLTEEAKVDRPIYLSYRGTNGFIVIFPDLSVLNFSTGQGKDGVSYMNLLPPTRGHLGHTLTKSALERMLEVHDVVPFSLIAQKLDELIAILNKATKEMHYYDGANILDTFDNTEAPY